MGPRLINTVLYTLVIVNLLALIFGGLVTWLGYSIPIRLRQFGLSPELTQLAGLGSSLIACLGLGALNYSSHYALNAYGLSCSVFIVFMLFGMIPDKWRLSIKEQQQSTLHQQLLHANYTSTVAGLSSPKGPATGLVLDLIYCALLVIFGTLVVFAVIFAQYLRRHERELCARSWKLNHPCDSEATCDRLNCTCDRPLSLAQPARCNANKSNELLSNLPGLTEELLAVASAGGQLGRPPPPPPGLEPSRVVASESVARTGGAPMKNNLSSRSLVSLGAGLNGNQEQGELGLADEQSASLRHQARPTANLSPLVHGGFYYANAKSAAALDETHGGRVAELYSLAQTHGAYRNQMVGWDATRCRCMTSSSVASTLAAKLRPDWPLHYQPAKAHQFANAAAGTMPSAMKFGGPHAAAFDPRRPTGYGPSHYATISGKQKRSKASSGASVMAMTAAAAAALFGGVVDTGPLDGDGGGGADGMLESSLDDCGAHNQAMGDDYSAHLYHGMQSGGGASLGQHDGHHSLPSVHHNERGCDFDDGHNELTGTQGTQMDQHLMYAPAWDYGPMMSDEGLVGGLK